MLDAIARAAVYVLAPCLALASMILTVFAYISPGTGRFHSHLAFAIIQSVGVDGPTIRMGALGSCAQLNSSAPVYCTATSVSPTYDLSVLPSNTPIVMQPPARLTLVFMVVGVTLWGLFFIIFSVATMLTRSGGILSRAVRRPAVVRAVASVGVLGYVIGSATLFVNRVIFGKAVYDFNIVAHMGKGDPLNQFTATVGSGFTLLYYAYASGAVPLLYALWQVHQASQVQQDRRDQQMRHV